MSSRPLWQRLVVVRVGGADRHLLQRDARHRAGNVGPLLDATNCPRGSPTSSPAWSMLIPAFFLILLVGWVLDNVFIEVADAPAGTTPAKKPGAAGAKAAKVVRVTKPAGARVVQIPRPAAKLLPDVRADGVALALPAPAAPRAQGGGRDAGRAALEAQEAAVAAPPAQAPGRRRRRRRRARPAGRHSPVDRPPPNRRQESPQCRRQRNPSRPLPPSPPRGRRRSRWAASPRPPIRPGMKEWPETHRPPRVLCRRRKNRRPPRRRPAAQTGWFARHQTPSRANPTRRAGNGHAQPPKKPATQAPQTTQINAAPTEEGL